MVQGQLFTVPPPPPEKLNAIGIKRRNETEQININIGDLARLRNLITAEAKLLLYKAAISCHISPIVISCGISVRHRIQERLKECKSGH